MMYQRISKEWDDLAGERFETFSRKTDLSYENVLKPHIFNVLSRCDLSNVLDVGCGVGALTKEIAYRSRRITGIDISPISIDIAIENNRLTNIDYSVLNVENLDKTNEYTTVIANMVLMDLPDITPVLSAIYNSMKLDSRFIFTITHPSFWPIYWGYFNDEGFKYKLEIEIEKEFKIKNQLYKGKKTRHFHRPIEYYINNIVQSGFGILSIHELQGNDEEHWYPRFMLFEVQKT